MDVTDRATEQEERQREAAIAKARNSIQSRDIEAELCNGCDYASKASWGKRCDGWAECLKDLQRREAKR